MDIRLPSPDALQRRIADCQAELRSLRRLLRVAQDAYDAEAARRRRSQAPAMPEESCRAD
ncbi:MAG TPA: hypothetical protein VMG10_12065 [Gemmataceae bacterium]|nr:hypothetical protein [Gemmataceae bacterium]